MNLSIFVFYISSFFVLNTLAVVNTLPIIDNVNNDNMIADISPSKSIEFNFTLPNHQVLKVNISLLMLKESKELEIIDDTLNDYYYDVNIDDTRTTTTTTTTPTTTISTDNPLHKYFTVDDAIEAFRKDLITQELNIGGIIESKNLFYRHFNLQYEDVNIPIRCTYDSTFEKQKLKISCFEYREVERERILSNGEIEQVRIPDLTLKLHNIQIVNLKNYQQTYKMNIE